MQKPTAFMQADPKPNEALIEDALGSAYEFYRDFLTLLHEDEIEHNWIYYKDGGWLFKIRDGKRNLACGAVFNNYTQITIYFAERHWHPLIMNPNLSEALSTAISGAVLIDNLLPATVQLRSATAVDDAVQLIKAKRNLH